MKRSLTKQERLKKKKDISRVFASSNKVSCFGAKLFYRENGLDTNRLMVTLVRNYGSSVQRNRAKRVMKEAYRLMKASLQTGFDMVIVLFPHTDTLQNRMNQLQQLCSKAALSTNPDTTWKSD
jgi:ribonuclease P protein component